MDSNGVVPNCERTDRFEECDDAHVTSVAKPKRRMTRDSLMGLHQHTAQDGQNVQIWRRGEKYLARMRREGRQRGVTLGSDPKTATSELINLLASLGHGTFIPPSEARRRNRKRKRIPLATLVEVADDFLDHIRKTKGNNTARAYQSRLSPVLEFADLKVSRKKWGIASDLDRDFALQLKAHLSQRLVSRNGRFNCEEKALMAPKSIRLALETLSNVLNWAVSPYVRMLPPEFVNPFTNDILGPKPIKDPLRSCPLPVEKRIEIVQHMDLWELTNLCTLLTLPTRCEDVTGAVISDFDLEKGTWMLGTRFGGNDFNKGRVNVLMPLPEEIIPILRRAKGGRADGPMFLQRTRSNRRRTPVFNSPEELRQLVDRRLATARREEVETAQDRKQIIRRLLRDCGAIAGDSIHRALRGLFTRVGVPTSVRTSELRSAVSTDMRSAGVQHLELRYLTLHTVNDIMNDYSPVGPPAEMRKHFNHIKPLLIAMQTRFQQLNAD